MKDMFKERECCTAKSAGGRRKGSGGRRDAVPPADTTYVLQKDTHTHTQTQLLTCVCKLKTVWSLSVCLSICHTVSLSDCQTVPNYSAFLEPENGRVCVCAPRFESPPFQLLLLLLHLIYDLCLRLFSLCLLPLSALLFSLCLRISAFWRGTVGGHRCDLETCMCHICVVLTPPTSLSDVTSRRSQRLKSTCATIIDLPLQFRSLLFPSPLRLTLPSPSIL